MNKKTDLFGESIPEEKEYIIRHVCGHNVKVKKTFAEMFQRFGEAERFDERPCLACLAGIDIDEAETLPESIMFDSDSGQLSITVRINRTAEAEYPLLEIAHNGRYVKSSRRRDDWRLIDAEDGKKCFPFAPRIRFSGDNAARLEAFLAGLSLCPAERKRAYNITCAKESQSSAQVFIADDGNRMVYQYADTPASSTLSAQAEMFDLRYKEVSQWEHFFPQNMCYYPGQIAIFTLVNPADMTTKDFRESFGIETAYKYDFEIVFDRVNEYGENKRAFISAPSVALARAWARYRYDGDIIAIRPGDGERSEFIPGWFIAGEDEPED